MRDVILWSTCKFAPSVVYSRGPPLKWINDDADIHNVVEACRGHDTLSSVVTNILSFVYFLVDLLKIDKLSSFSASWYFLFRFNFGIVRVLTWYHVDWHTQSVLYKRLSWKFAHINTHPYTICLLQKPACINFFEMMNIIIMIFFFLY
jgi:hypothetical protein